jgi:hypothetical protein
MAMEDYELTHLPSERCVVCVASTTGEGEVPDNMRSFWRFLLRKDLPPGSLSNLMHACFGLGDSSYPKFNYAAKRLHRRLEHLGSTALLPLGLGDDMDSLGVDQVRRTRDSSHKNSCCAHATTGVCQQQPRPTSRNFIGTLAMAGVSVGKGGHTHAAALSGGSRSGERMPCLAVHGHRSIRGSHAASGYFAPPSP